jgi:two-component system chemotaxis response regulator CheB
MINGERIVRDVIVIGASAGGVQALLGLLGRLPDALPAAVAIVLHRSPFHETRLPWVLGRRTKVRVVEPSEGEPVEHGTVYVAPRDRHLVFRDGTVWMDGVPREHRTRPAIDPLFRTAAAFYGPRVVGVLLSGMGGDGVSGLMHIKAHGGLSMVQSPAEAQFVGDALARHQRGRRRRRVAGGGPRRGADRAGRRPGLRPRIQRTGA